MIRTDCKIGEARLLVWEITESLESLQAEIKDSASLRALSQISLKKAKLSFLAVRVVLKKILGKEQVVSYHDSGKPYLERSPYSISISHSGRWVAVLLHPGKEVGVDIQCPTEKITKVHKRFLSKKEIESLPSIEACPEQYLVAWAAKEALYKILGATAVDFRKDLELQSFVLKEKGELAIKHMHSEQKYRLHYLQNNNYALVFCVC